MSYLDKVRRCNQRDLSRFIPFVIEGVQFGWLTPERAEVLLGLLAVFRPCVPGNINAGVTFAASSAPGADPLAERSRAVAEAATALTASGLFLEPRGELYGIKNRWSDAPVLLLDRAFVPGFGARAFGVHINGYVRKRDGIHLWIGTRARSEEHTSELQSH